MKLFFVLSMLTLQTQVFGSETIKLEVFPNAKIVKVECGKPGHINHDESLAGYVTISTDEEKIVNARIIVSRFSDETAEAKALCAELKNALLSKKSFDVIVERLKEYSGQDENDKEIWKEVLNVKGAKTLHGLDPFYNG